MTAPVFDWTRERHELEAFLSSGHQVVHISGTNGAYFGHFQALITRVCEAFSPPTEVVHVDLFNQATASPFGLTTFVCKALGLDVPTQLDPPEQRVSVASNIRALGPVNLRDIQVHIASRSESELLQVLTDGIQAEIDRGLNLHGRLLLFQQCHELKMRQRKLLWSSAWSPVLMPLLKCGLKTAFLYCDEEFSLEESALPPEPQKHIRLSDDRTHLTEAEIALFVEERGLEDAGDRAHGYASAILGTSVTVREVYEKLAFAVLRRQ